MADTEAPPTGPQEAGPEACPEAAAILRDAGWAPHNRWLIYTTTRAVMGFDHSGSFHHKTWAMDVHGPDYPDDPVEAARWLVARFPKFMADNQLSLASLEDEAAPLAAVEGADMAAPSVNINVNPVFNVSGTGGASGGSSSSSDAEQRAIRDAEALFEGGASDETHGSPDAVGNSASEIGSEFPSAPPHDGNTATVGPIAVETVEGADTELTDVLQSEDAGPAAEAIEDPVHSGAGVVEDDETASLGDAESGTAIQRGQVHDELGQDEPGDSDLPYALDADFEEIGNDREELAALEFGAEVEDDFLPPPKSEEAAPPPQDRFIGLDDLDRRRSLRIGDVIRYALEHTPRMSGTEIDRLRNLRSYVAGVAEQTVTRSSDDSAMRAELNELEALLGIEHAWDAARDQKVTFLNAAERADVEAFDPERDWPA